MEKEILKVKESNQGCVGQVFMMKRNIMGQKKAGTEPHAIKDPITGELLVANEDIKKATLKYCAANLQNKKIQKLNLLLIYRKHVLWKSLKRCLVNL